MPSSTGNAIQLFYSKTASNTPTASSLVDGELAINIADGKLYYKDTSSVVKLLASMDGSGLTYGILNVDNLRLDANTLSSTDSNGNINITPNGTGIVQIPSLTATGAVTFSGTTTNIAIGTSQTTGLLSLGGSTQTGSITLGQSTGAQTVNVATGATTTGITKSVNLGTGGVSGSTTNIVLGSSVSGATNNISIYGTLTSSDSAAAVGYKGLPINSQSVAYTLVLSDQSKAILHPIADNNARTFTIPANSSVAFPVGTVITFINLINTVTISITTDTMYLIGPGLVGSRTLAAYGMASAVKVDTTTWIISGSGLT